VPARASTARTASHFALRLGSGASPDVTVLSGKAAGGAVYADVETETDGAAFFTKKRPGRPQFENFLLPVGLVMSDELFDWLAASWGPQPPEKDGAVLTLDYQMSVRTEAVFGPSLIRETRFPAIDAASADAGHVTLEVQPPSIHVEPGAGTVPLVGAKQKLWRTANFRLDIDGLDCKHVSRLEPFRVRREVQLVLDGAGVAQLVPGTIDFPNLSITLSKAFADSWYDWHETFVVEGENDDALERDGSLSFLSVNLLTELARIDLRHLGIVKIAPAEDDAMHVTAELYCEEMVLSRPQPGGSP
jgi:hypothetical protein